MLLCRARNVEHKNCFYFYLLERPRLPGCLTTHRSLRMELFAGSFTPSQSKQFEGSEKFQFIRKDSFETDVEAVVSKESCHVVH